LKIYEILFLIRPNLEKEELSNHYKSIENSISKYAGTIESVQDLGKRSLAYQIKKHKEGIYYLMNIKMDPQNLKGLEDELKLSEPILRMAFMKLDEKTLAAKLAAK